MAEHEAPTEQVADAALAMVEITSDESVPTDEVVLALRECYDPEIPLNIVDLGLVYTVEVREHKVMVTMTLTAMGCPFAPQVVSQVEERLLDVEGVAGASVEIVYFPPWTPERMTEDARWQLGMV
jgi:metal-sulfur cluster biosynthetic enzyme